MEPANSERIETKITPPATGEVAFPAEIPKQPSGLRRLLNFLLRKKASQAAEPTASIPKPEYVAPPSPRELWEISRGERPESQVPDERSMSTADLAKEVARVTRPDQESEDQVAKASQPTESKTKTSDKAI